jgi:anti-anti-sigma factor
VSYRFGLLPVYLSGELDHQAAGELRPVIEQELSARATGLLLGLSELRYIDSGGLSLLFETLQRLKDTGGLGVVAPNVGVGKLMEMIGLVGRQGFHIFPDLASINAALAKPPEAPDSR